MEVGCGQADQVIRILEETERFKDIAVREDLAGIPRVVSAKRSGLQ
jgi:methylase of polypeptide subunit release factors